MMKFFFWILLLANAGLFAYRQGYLDTMMPSSREPARMSNQLNADKVKLIPAADALAATGKKADGWTCTEVGNFSTGEAKRFELRLAALALDGRVSQRGIQEVVSHIVYVPPQGDKEGADKKVEELRRLGIEDLYIIQDDSSLRWGISLGVFKQEEGARAHLADLARKGVRSARIASHSVATSMVAFQIRDLDADTKARIDKIKEDFPRQEIRNCQRPE
ncbi:MAG: hypothetical protein V7642_2722 [Burkholderiales bacterium]